MKTEHGIIECTGPSSWRVITKSQHVCGLQGYGQSLDDRCLACEEGYALWQRRKEESWPLNKE